MKDVNRLPFPGPSNLAVKVFLRPAGEHFRLGLRKVGLHGKVGARQIDGLLYVHIDGIHSEALLYWRFCLTLRRWRRNGGLGALVLDDQGHAPVACVGRMGRVSGTLIGEAAYLGDLIRAHAVLLHPASGGIRAVTR